ncbi:MAG: laccase domain-containing protein [Adlercreutzia equolifaciens]
MGPHIGAECYECGPDLVGRFVERFGASCAYGADHLDLEAAVRASLAEGGIAPARIASSGSAPPAATTSTSRIARAGPLRTPWRLRRSKGVRS